MNIVKSIKVLFVSWCMVQSSFAYGVSAISASSTNDCPAKESLFQTLGSNILSWFGGISTTIENESCNLLRNKLETLPSRGDAVGEAATHRTICETVLNSDEGKGCTLTKTGKDDLDLIFKDIRANDKIKSANIMKMQEKFAQLAELARVSEALLSDPIALADYSAHKGEKFPYESNIKSLKQCSANMITDVLKADNACGGGADNADKRAYFNEIFAVVKDNCADNIEKCGLRSKDKVSHPDDKRSFEEQGTVLGMIEGTSFAYGVNFPKYSLKSEIKHWEGVIGINTSPEPQKKITNIELGGMMHDLVGLLISRSRDANSKAGITTNEQLFKKVRSFGNLEDEERNKSLINFANQNARISENKREIQNLAANALYENMGQRIKDSGWRENPLSEKLLNAQFTSKEEVFAALGIQEGIATDDDYYKALSNYKVKKIGQAISECNQIKQEFKGYFCGNGLHPEISADLVEAITSQSSESLNDQAIRLAQLNCFNIKNADTTQEMLNKSSDKDAVRVSCQRRNEVSKNLFTDEAIKHLGIENDCGTKDIVDPLAKNISENAKKLATVTSSKESAFDVYESNPVIVAAARVVNRQIQEESDRVRKILRDKRKSNSKSNSNLTPNGIKVSSVVSGVIDSDRSSLTNNRVAGVNSPRNFIGGVSVNDMVDTKIDEIIERDDSESNGEDQMFINELKSMREKLALLEKRLKAKQEEQKVAKVSNTSAASSAKGALANEVMALKEELAKARLEASNLIKENQKSKEAKTSTATVSKSAKVVSNIPTGSAAVAKSKQRTQSSLNSGFASKVSGGASTNSVDAGASDGSGSNFSFVTSGVLRGRGAVERTSDQVSDLEQISGYNVSIITEKVAGGRQVVVETEGGEKLLCEKSDEDQSGIACKTLSIVDQIRDTDNENIIAPLSIDPARDVMRLRGLDAIMEREEE